MGTQRYKENIYKNGRKTVVQVRYSLTAPESKEGGSLNLPESNELSRPTQTMNEERAISAPIATFEPDYWRLDGSFALPLPPVETDSEVGWWSDAMSGEDCILPESLVIERVFDTVQTFNTLSITFDGASNNYCTDFEVFFYDAYGGLIYSEHISDNTLATRSTERAGIDILRVVVKLNKTSEPYRYARVAEIDFGLVLEYTNDSEIKSVSLIREADPSGKTYPQPEFRLTILNNGMYDQLDSSTYAPYFQTRQRFEYHHGLVLPDNSIEWVNCGIYFLTGWSVSDKVVEFTASGKTANIENTTYFGSNFEQYNISQLVHRIFPHAEIDITSPKIPGYFGKIDYRRAAAILAELSCCLVYEDRKNTVRFDDVLCRDINPVMIYNYTLDGSWKLGKKPFGKKTAGVDELNYSNIFQPPKVSLSSYYNAINLSEYTPSAEKRQISNSRHKAGKIEIYFDNPVIGTPEYEVTNGFTLTNIIWHTMYMTATLEGRGEAEITITGESITFAKSETIYKAPWHTGREVDIPYPVDLPMMIRGQGYEEFRDWFLERRFKVLAKRLNCDIPLYQNPERETGDIVNVQISSKHSDADMIIVRQELTYNSALRGSSKVIGNPVMR